jgi:hypothetical protein
MALQGLLVVVLLGSAWLGSDSPLATRLYLWSVVVPIGFALVFTQVYRDPAWEGKGSRRAYAWLGVVLLVWLAGIGGVLLLR